MHAQRRMCWRQWVNSSVTELKQRKLFQQFMPAYTEHATFGPNIKLY
jgi:hypothetical protein